MKFAEKVAMAKVPLSRRFDSILFHSFLNCHESPTRYKIHARILILELLKLVPELHFVVLSLGNGEH